jgi:FKBP-type peptidyl-prolyl cis-trans isomerase FkpA
MKTVCFVLLAGLIFGCSTDKALSYDEQLALDVAAIDKYLKDNGLTAASDPSGLRYTVSVSGGGARPTVANTITVKYSGKLMTTGNVFDSSNSATFPLANLIKGWQIGFPLLTEGSEAILYVPSGLAYGGSSQPTIPANSNLIFNVKLIKVQ